METFYYPSRFFLKNIASAVRNGNSIKIVTSAGRKKEILLSELVDLLNDHTPNDNTKKTSWKYMLCMFLEVRFFTAYFYAKSANYTVSYIDDGELTVVLEPP
jgi:hypothetical protein